MWNSDWTWAETKSMQVLWVEVLFVDHLPSLLPLVDAFDQHFPLLFLAALSAPYTSQTLQARPYFTASVAPPAPGNHNLHQPEWRKWLWFPSTFHTSNRERERRVCVSDLTELDKHTRATVCVHMYSIKVCVWRSRWVHFFLPQLYITCWLYGKGKYFIIE